MVARMGEKAALPARGPWVLRAKVSAWIWACRPFTLSAAIVPVCVGSALAFQEHIFNFVSFLLVLIASLLVQAVANLVDEYADDTRPEGKGKHLAPYKVIALGKLSRREVKIGAVVMFLAATAIGLYLSATCGWPVFAIALASGAAMFFYAAGPMPLGSVGLGQPLVFVFMGPAMVIGSYYVQARAFSTTALVLSVPVAFTVTAILAANDIRDRDEDAESGKRTIASALGRKAAVYEWSLLIVAAFLSAVSISITGTRPFPMLIALLAFPSAWQAFRTLRGSENRSRLALGLRHTARFHLLFGTLIAVGVAIARYI